MSAAWVAPLVVLALARIAAAEEHDETHVTSLPADAVAQVDNRVIDRSQYRHWRRVARKASGEDTSESQLRRQVMSFLVSGAWIALEAKRREIRVTKRQVRRAFRRQRQEAFETRRQFRRYLRTSGQTKEDLLYRVRLDLLSLKVRKDVLRGIDGARRRERRLARFKKRFTTRWRERTICARGYRVGECGSVTEPDAAQL